MNKKLKNNKIIINSLFQNKPLFLMNIITFSTIHSIYKNLLEKI